MTPISRWTRLLRPGHESIYDGPVARDPLLFYTSPLQLWVGRLVRRVNRTGTIEDKWLPVFTHASQHLRNVFSKLRREHGAKASFLLQWEVVGLLLLGGGLEILSVIASLGGPLLLYKLLNDLRNMPLALSLVAVNILASVAGRAKDQVSRVQSTWIETMIRAAIFEKSLHLSPAARIAHPPAQIINMSAVDVSFVSTYVSKVHDIWSAPMQLIGIAVLASTLLGTTALFGFLLMLILCFGQSWASRLTRTSYTSYIKLNDQRLAALRELLINIKSVKATAYEFVYSKLVSKVRNEQLSALRLYLSAGFAIFTAFSESIPVFTAATAFLAYYLTGHELTAAVVFPALAYFNMLYQPIFAASLAITRQFAVWPSVVRLRTFMSADESGPQQHSAADGTDVAIDFHHAVFTHSSYKDEPEEGLTLDVGDLSIPRNRFTALIGPTGSGKSNFLQAVLGEMSLSSGSYNTYGSVAYAAQDAWVISGTLQDNIVFVKEFDTEKYREVTRLCALDQDFASFPGGDQFQVAESGSNLSGGQRMRIALARALYAEPDILLLDDPLSAVDGQVRQVLFDTLRSLTTTVVLVTLHTSFIPRADNVVVMNKSRVSWCGPPSELLADAGLRGSILGEHWVHEGDQQKVTSTDNADTHSKIQDDASGNIKDLEDIVELVEDEERAKGAVKWRVAEFYSRRSGGITQAISVLLMAVLLTGSRIMASYWFVWWIKDSFSLKQGQYLGVYLGLTIAQTLFTGFLSLTLVSSSMKASRSIHKTIVDNLLSAPLWFFQRQPVGRILNRLSSDVGSLDFSVINAVDAIFGAGSTLVASLCLVAVASPIMLTTIIPYISLTTWLQYRFKICAREVQRTISILQSPVTTILSESLNAPASIKAYKAIPFMVGRHDQALDQLMSAKITRKSLDTWVTLRAEAIAVLVLLVIALLTVHGVIAEVQAGLTLSIGTTLSKNVYLLTWAFTEIEIQMNSIERLKTYYDSLPRENLIDREEEDKVPEGWPIKADIEMRDVFLKYPSRQAPALDGINLTIKAGERVGIVGRTGSGKSTLISSIARLTDITSGNISIGGIDISKIPPSRLRHAVHTLPQEPLIFEGTLRDNLDPEGAVTDTELLGILNIVQLGDFVMQPGKEEPLQQKLGSGGVDLSAGQRQLLCAARALLQLPRVLLVDEAAANVDFDSDEALQNALQDVSDLTTMLIIAHRAASLAWLDRIIVMENGRIVENGTPYALLRGLDNPSQVAMPESYYRSAVRQEGEGAFQRALDIAKTRHDRRLDRWES